MDVIDVEQVIIDWLGERLGISATAEVPNPRPEKFVTVERTGGSRTGLVVDRPTVAIQCWAGSRAEASALAVEVDGMLQDLAYERGINEVVRQSLHNFPDEMGNQRYQLFVELKTTN